MILMQQTQQRFTVYKFYLGQEVYFVQVMYGVRFDWKGENDVIEVKNATLIKTKIRKINKKSLTYEILTDDEDIARIRTISDKEYVNIFQDKREALKAVSEFKLKAV